MDSRGSTAVMISIELILPFLPWDQVCMMIKLFKLDYNRYRAVYFNEVARLTLEEKKKVENDDIGNRLFSRVTNKHFLISLTHNNTLLDIDTKESIIMGINGVSDHHVSMYYNYYNILKSVVVPITINTAYVKKKCPLSWGKYSMKVVDGVLLLSYKHGCGGSPVVGRGGAMGENMMISSHYMDTKLVEFLTNDILVIDDEWHSHSTPTGRRFKRPRIRYNI